MPLSLAAYLLPLNTVDVLSKILKFPDSFFEFGSVRYYFFHPFYGLHHIVISILLFVKQVEHFFGQSIIIRCEKVSKYVSFLS